MFDNNKNQESEKQNSKTGQSNKAKRDFADAKEVLKVIESKTFKFIFWFIVIGVALCFIAQFVSYKTINFTKAAEIWNVFVILLLGIIATIVSLISLFFSFYNTKQSYDNSQDSLSELIIITEKLKDSSEKQEQFLQELHKFDQKTDENITRLENI